MAKNKIIIGVVAIAVLLFLMFSWIGLGGFDFIGEKIGEEIGIGELPSEAFDVVVQIMSDEFNPEILIPEDLKFMFVKILN